MEDVSVLSFHDSLLRQSDVALLDGTNWLNDKIIGFYFEYLEYRTFANFASSVCFITPDVTQFIKLYEGPELGIFLEPLVLQEREFVSLAVNDNASTNTAGGSHWSALVYVREENAFYHLDSWTPTNTSPAKACAQKITPFLRVSSSPSFREVSECPQQKNCYDCGVYALCFVEVMCKIKLLKEPEDQLQSISEETVQQWRRGTKQLITDLAKENNA